MNIYEKLLNITSDIATVNKNLIVGEGKSKYKAVGEADVLKAVKELEKKYGIYSYPCKREVIDSQILITEKEYNDTITKSTKQFMRIETIYRFVNIEKPEEFIEVTTYGDGVDSQDKAPGKAMTYSDKYALLKAYKMITGDDPDQNISEENEWQVTSKSENPYVTKAEAIACYKLMTKKGLNVVEQLKSNYGIDNTEKLTKEQYLSIVKAVTPLPDKKIKNINEI
jgi:hypothetical protein